MIIHCFFFSCPFFVIYDYFFNREFDILEYAIVYYGLKTEEKGNEKSKNVLEEIQFQDNMDSVFLKIQFKKESTIVNNYNNINPDGLCWLRSYYHSVYGHDPKITQKEDRDKFITFIEEE